MTIEDLFAAEAQLRRAASDYSSVEHTQQSIGCRRDAMKALRVAAVRYCQVAERFDRAMLALEEREKLSTEASDVNEVTQ